MDKYQEFQHEVRKNIQSQGQDGLLKQQSVNWIRDSAPHNYSYNFAWLGRPIIQFPQDILAIQEIIWQVRPDLIIETGIAHGGSIIFSASMLAMLDYCEAVESGKILYPKTSKRKVVGIDIDIRAHNRLAIEKHSFAHHIHMIEGSSIDRDIIEEVKDIAKNYERVMVFLDSNHTHDHVLQELVAYAPLTSTDSYIVVFDTIIEDMPPDMFLDRPWGPGNNPKTAVWEFLNNHPEYEIDKDIQYKLLITVAPDGFLKRIS